MISETQMRYGSRVPRHAIGRAAVRNHRRSAAEIHASARGSSIVSRFMSAMLVRGRGLPRPPRSILPSILLEERGEEVVVLLLVREDLVEEELRGLVPLLPGHKDDLLVHRDRRLLVLLVGLDHLLQRGADEDRRGLRGGDSPEVIQ